MADYPPQYLEGIRLFNEEEFYDCHDVLEELWADTPGEEKKFLQGLIQASVALFHFGNENLGGARKLYLSSRKYLEPYGDMYWGLDLKRFLADFQHCFQEILDAEDIYGSGVALRNGAVAAVPFFGRLTLLRRAPRIDFGARIAVPGLKSSQTAGLNPARERC